MKFFFGFILGISISLLWKIFRFFSDRLIKMFGDNMHVNNKRFFKDDMEEK